MHVLKTSWGLKALRQYKKAVEVTTLDWPSKQLSLPLFDGCLFTPCPTSPSTLPHRLLLLSRTLENDFFFSFFFFLSGLALRCLPFCSNSNAALCHSWCFYGCSVAGLEMWLYRPGAGGGFAHFCSHGQRSVVYNKPDTLSLLCFPICCFSPTTLHQTSRLHILQGETGGVSSHSNAFNFIFSNFCSCMFLLFYRLILPHTLCCCCWVFSFAFSLLTRKQNFFLSFFFLFPSFSFSPTLSPFLRFFCHPSHFIPSFSPPSLRLLIFFLFFTFFCLHCLFFPPFFPTLSFFSLLRFPSLSFLISLSLYFTSFSCLSLFSPLRSLFPLFSTRHFSLPLSSFFFYLPLFFILLHQKYKTHVHLNEWEL